MPRFIDGRITARNVKVFDSMSEESIALCADLYLDGKKAARATCRGCGDGVNVEVLGNSKLHKEFSSVLASEAMGYALKEGGASTEHPSLNEDQFITDLCCQVDDLARIRGRIRKSMKAEIFVRLPDGSYKTVRPKSRPYNMPAIREFLDKRYPDGFEIVTDVDRIAKDLFLASLKAQ